jgi:uncharacterized protein
VRYVIFFLVASLVMAACHRYVWARLVRDLSLPQPWSRIATIVVVGLFVLLMSSFMLYRVVGRSFAPLMWVTYTWLGILFFLVLFMGVTDIARLITYRVQDVGPQDIERRDAITRMFAGAAAVLGLGVSGAGLASALSTVSIKKVKVAINRLSASASGTRIVQITDVHVGPTIGKSFIEEVVSQINSLNPDVVVITGDLVDGSVEELKDHVAPLGKIKAKHGVFFVTGNHEYYSGAESWMRHLEETLGVRVLRNEHVRIGGENGFDLAGIDDPTSRESDLKKALEGRENDRACVLLAHQPRAIHLADQLGVDLQLSGHTHGGQLFPWNFMVRLQQPFVAGLHKLQRAQIYVSQGTGYWGPPMRVGAPAEITEIEIVKA